MSTAGPQSIFISHTHGDEEVAHAFREAVHTLFGDSIAVRYSTSKELEGGIKPGEDWFRWIGEQVRQSRVALILLTPSSVQKPWVLWEGGAVAGAALASDDAGSRKLWPISYKLRSGEIPTPFGRSQVTDGLSETDISKLFEDMLNSFHLSQDRVIKAAQRLATARTAYLARATEAVRTAPMLVTEASVQEWLERIDGLERENRVSETDELHDWLNVAFGRAGAGEDRPLDLRIHRRLGELYSRAGNAERAAREFELAAQLAPRDIYILRRLGKGYLDQRRLDEAEKIIQLIAELDAKAFARNAENAALKARYHRERGDPAAALAVLRVASEASPTSYYLADLLAQAQLELGRLEEAKDTYRRTLEIIDRIRERNVWVAASGFTAAAVVGDAARQAAFLTALEQAAPSADQAAAIHRGVREVARRGGTDKAALDRLETALGLRSASQ